MSEIKNIPKHWQVKKLGEVCERITKGGTPTTYGFSFVTSGVNFIKIENIKHGKVNLSSIKTFITEDAHSFQKKSILLENDLLFSIAGTIGETCLIKREYLPANTNQALAILRGYIKTVQPQFLTFQLSSSISQYVKTKARGGAMNNISLEDLKGIELVVPPLPEQLAIVSKIEELLSELENGKQQLQTAEAQLKVYRQSLLKWAFEGKLTNKKVKEGELPKGWKWVRMGDVCEKIQDGSHFSPQVQYDKPGENRFKYITAKNIRNNYMDFRKVIYVDKDYHDSIFSRCNPEFGDVLLTKDGINTGEITLNTLHEPFSLLSSVCLFKTKKQILISSYLKYFIQSPFGNKAIMDSMTGTAIKRIVLRKIKDAKIILSSLSEQQIIVDELESKLTNCDKIEETISQSLQQAETLKQSILKKAFEGELINKEKNATI